MTVVVNGRAQGLRAAFHDALDQLAERIDWTRGVFLKPNVVFAAKPSSGEITSPENVRTLIGVLRERYGELDIVMGDGVAVGRNPAENFRVSGFEALARESGVRLIDLNEAPRRQVEWKYGQIALPEIATDRAYINLPILKRSSACLISGAMKNQKGLVAPATKKQFHRLGLHAQIAALNAAIAPDITIMDCSTFFGLGALISGDNCGEIDFEACRMLGVDEPEHVRLAREMGVFAPGFEVRGDSTARTRITAKPEWHESKRLGRIRLWANPRACTACRAVFRDVKEDALRPTHLSGKLKLARCVLRGAEVLMGSDPAWREGGPRVICVGSCTRAIATERGYAYVPGCPPTLDDFYKHLPRQ